MRDDETKKIEEAYKRIEARKYFQAFTENFVCLTDSTDRQPLSYIGSAPDLKQMGRYTVFAYGKEWVALTTEKTRGNFVKYYEQILLKETPDVIIGLDGQTRYIRGHYEGYIFFSDGLRYSLVWGNLHTFPSHAHLFRGSHKGDPEVKYFTPKNREDVDIIAPDFDFSGVIIPKQASKLASDPDVDVSYVSIWCTNKDNVFLETIKSFATMLNVPTPIYLEYMPSKNAGESELTKDLLLA